MRWVLFCLLCACRAPEPTDTSVGDTDTDTDTDTGADTSVEEVIPFVSPAVGVDLDPDPDILHVELEASAVVTEDGSLSYAYNGQIPGPTLRAKVGDTLIVDLHNGLEVETTIHWHGVHVPFAMDGVTWQTDPVYAGEDFRYTFVLDRAGTFWYHPHFDTLHQVDLGLYGMLIVDDPALPVAQVDEIAVFDSWNEELHDELDPNTDHHQWVEPSEWTINGLQHPTLTIDEPGVVKLSMVNASNAGYLDLRWPDLKVIGTDQGVLAAPITDDRIVLGPGDRAVAELLVGNEPIQIQAWPYSLAGEVSYSDPSTVLTVRSDTEGNTPSGLDWPFSGQEPDEDPEYTDLLYTFSGDNITGVWTINGEIFPYVTVESVALNSTAIIEVRNISPTEHPFHLHGHHFEILSQGGVAPNFKTIEDTVNVEMLKPLRIKLLADNPGDWMTHCHILPHADQGMMTVLRVE